MNQWIQIFRAGAYPGKLPITVDDLKAIASGYDPRRSEAPLVLGHPDSDSPAHGWVEQLRVIRDQLWAKVRQVSPELKRLVREGAFKRISMAVFPEFEATGKMYLRHVGFLGAATPAVKGMAPVKFAEGAFESVDLELPIAEALDRQAGIMRVLDGCSLLCERIYGLLDDETVADKRQAILDQVESLRALVEAEQFAEGEGGSPMKFWERLKALFVEAGIPVPGEEPPAPAAGQFTEDQVRAREQAAAAKALADAEVKAARAARAQAVHAEVTAFVEAGIQAGTFLPAWKEAGLPQVLEQTMLAEAEVTFAEGQPPKRVGEILLGLFKSLPKIVPLGEHAQASGTDPEAALKAEFAAGLAVHEQTGVTFEHWKKTRGV
jgi:hypothetical protein